MKTEPSINLLYQHAVTSNQVVLANVNVMLFSFFQNLAQGIMCKGKTIEEVGVDSVITPGSKFLWGKGAPKLSPKPIAVAYTVKTKESIPLL